MTIPDSDWLRDEMAMLKELSHTFAIFSFGDYHTPQYLGALRKTIFCVDVLIIRAANDLVAHRASYLPGNDPWRPQTVLWHTRGTMPAVLSRMMTLSETDNELSCPSYPAPDCCKLPHLAMHELRIRWKNAG
jgi:hypothetical protein